MKNMSVLVGPNNSGKTNILQALDLLLGDRTFEKDRDFRLSKNIPQSHCVISALVNEIKEDEVTLLPDRAKEFAKQGVLYIKKEFELVSSKTPKQTFSIASTAQEDDLTACKPDERNAIIGWLPHYYYIPSDDNLDTAEKVIKQLIGLIIAESGLETLKRSYEQIFDSNELKNVLSSLEAEFSTFLSQMWSEIRIRFRASGHDISSLLSEAISYNIEEKDHEVSLEMIGNGFQRTLMLAAFSAYAKHVSENTRTRNEIHRKKLFAIEEPELYLHPHLQRRLYDILQSISRTDQVILCTHSQNLVRIEDYKSIYLIRKQDAGTSVRFWRIGDDIPNAREQFLYITKLGPANEVFFAQKAILVEGESELVSFPVIFTKLRQDASLDERGITIVNCQGKTNIPLFQKVLNTFEVPYIAVYDKDTTDHVELNAEIRSLTENIGTAHAFVFNPDFNDVLGVGTPKKGKPQACYEFASRIHPGAIPEELKRLCNIVFS